MKPVLVQWHAIRTRQLPHMRHQAHTMTCSFRTACRDLWREIGVRVPILTNVDQLLY